MSGGVAIADISIHASRMGGDAILHQPSHGHGYFNPRLPDGRRLANTMRYLFDPIFQSTPPGWEATYGITVRHTKHVISIHASRMGGDRLRDSSSSTPRHFNPRLPDGRRRWSKAGHADDMLFQSTPPGWEATKPCPACMTSAIFQSTPPGWEATQWASRTLDYRSISIHASRMGGDRENGHTVPRYGKNIHSRH